MVATQPPARQRPGGAQPVDAELASYLARARPANLTGLEKVSALSAFQRQMSQWPQLAPEEMAALVETFQNGQQAKVELEQGQLTDRQRRRLARTLHEGERAAEQIIGSSFRLVWVIVREKAERRFGREQAQELLPDLVSEANIAVIEAAMKFDPTRGPNFPVYLAMIVRDRINMVLGRQAPMRVSASWNRIKRIAAVRIPTLESELGRPPTRSEIQDDLLERCLEWATQKLSEEQLALPPDRRRALMLAKLRRQGMLGAIKNIDDVLITTRTAASLDAAVGADRSTSLVDMLEGSNEDDGDFDAVEHAELAKAIQKALSKLPERDRQIISYRFGLVDGEPWKHAQIAAVFNITSERIRQIERSVLLQLADPNGAAKALRSFLPGYMD